MRLGELLLILARDRGSGPIFQRPGARLGIHLVDEPCRPLAHLDRDGCPAQALQARPRIGRPTQAALQFGQLQLDVRAGLGVPGRGFQGFAQKGQHLVAPLPAHRIGTPQLGQIHVGIEAARVQLDRLLEQPFRLLAHAQVGQGVAEIGRNRGVLGILVVRLAQQLGRISPRALLDLGQGLARQALGACAIERVRGAYAADLARIGRVPATVLSRCQRH